MINRSIGEYLVKWKESLVRKPLILRGARQVGKTFVVRQFAQRNFDNLVEINFEQEKDLKKVFNILDPKMIVEKIDFIKNKKIVPGKTLLFLDEIQEVPMAIMVLRYFYEQMPELHIIAAGSLLEFALNSQDFRMPVGRVEYAFLNPLTFKEFLLALNQRGLVDYIESLTLEKGETDIISKKVYEYLRRYFILGGMPEVVEAYKKNIPLESIENIQKSILQTYRDDFGKYSSISKLKYLEVVFEKIPLMIGEKFKYSQVSREYQNRDIKEALELLLKAGVINKTRHSAGYNVPLAAEAKEKFFKIFFLDVGLMQSFLNLKADIIKEEDFIVGNIGKVTEQFIGQELLAGQSFYEKKGLHFWARELKSSQAEVDYLVSKGSKVFPLEVKSGKTGSLKSMHQFLKDHPKCKLGLRFSTRKLALEKNILSIPLFMVSEWERLV